MLIEVDEKEAPDYLLTEIRMRPEVFRVVREDVSPETMKLVSRMGRLSKRVRDLEQRFAAMEKGK